MTPRYDSPNDERTGLIGGNEPDAPPAWTFSIDGARAYFIRAIRWLIDRDGIDGAVNIAAPNPLPNAEFMRALRQAWGAPIGLPATPWMLQIGALIMGVAEILGSQPRQ